MTRRILYLSPVAQVGGAELSLLELASRLDRSRFTPALACLGTGPLVERAERAGLPVHVVPVTGSLARASLRGRRSGAWRLAHAVGAAVPTVLRLRALVRAVRPDVVHSNGNKTHALSLLTTPADTRLIWHVRDFLPDRAFERRLIRRANRRCAALVANSAAVGRHLRALGASADLVRVVPTAIDTARFSPAGAVADLRAEFHWPPTARVIGIVAALARWKGQAEFLRALQTLRARGRDVRGVIVGEEIYATDGHGAFTEELRSLVADLGLRDAVAFAGRREDVAAVLRGLDVVVHASTEPEPFGRVVAEALACGRPLVATRGGGVGEIVGDGAAHVTTVGHGDPAALADAVAHLIDLSLAPPEVARARDRVVERFDVRGHVRAIEDLYGALTRPSVLHVGKFYPPSRGGMETVVARLCAGTAKRWRVRALVANERPRGVRERIDGVEVVRTARVTQAGALPVCPGLVWRLARARDACVVVHEPNPLAVLALALRPPACPFVLWHHADFLRPGWARPLYAWLRRRLVRAAACVVVSNPTLAGAAYLREARRIEVIPFGIPLSAFADPDARTVRRARELRAARAAPLVLFVGRLVYYKGVDVLLDAMRDCRARLALIGTGAEGDALRALARRLRVDDRVEFLGDLPAEELAAWYQAADVFVLPSTHATEAFGVVQVEAMASGVPVVSTDLPTGVPWVNQHGVTGLVVPPGDAGALAAALTCLLDDPQLRRKLGAAARRRALEEFAEARMIARFDALLAEVCPDRP